MKNFLNKIKQFVVSHKTLCVIILIIILIAGYYEYKKMTSTTGETRYVTAQVAKDTIISSITGTGQVSASNQIDVKPKVSGTITSVKVNPGDQVSEDETMFVIDDSDAQKTLRDAKISLESAKLALQKLQIQDSNENTDANLKKAYSDGFNAVSSTFLDLYSTINGINDILAKGNTSENTARNSGNTAMDLRNTAETAYFNVNTAYQKNKNDFAKLNYDSPESDTDNILSETYDTTKLLASAIKSLSDYINYLSQDTGRTSDYSSYQSSLSGYTNTINGHLSSLLSAETTIKSYKDSLPNNNIDTENALISIQQKQNALSDAQQNLSDYYIKAPFSGTIASVPVQKGNDASSGTTLTTIITQSKVATLSLNEVDVAKISLGQKATLTFDAIPDLTIAGKVIQIDSIGTVSSGVVNYTVKISFDTNDTRIKPGMSVNANIITNMKQDVLTISSSAIKSQNGTNYVETFDKALATPLASVQGSPSLTLPNKKDVVIGIYDDTKTEIVSGLNEGDIVVTKTITGTATTATKTTSTKSILGGLGGGPRN